MRLTIPELTGWLEEDFGSCASEILTFFLDDSGRSPVLVGHVPLAIQSSKLKLSEVAISHLNRGYNYLATYYFSIDAIVDGHQRGKAPGEPAVQIGPYIGAIVQLGIKHVRLAVECIAKDRVRWLDANLTHMFRENGQALRREMAIRIDPFAPRTENDNRIIVARANLMLFLFDLLWKLGRPEKQARLRKLLERYLVLLQDGDDLSDWRVDLHTKNWTPFLRTCFMKVGYQLNEEQLERLIYLDGTFEETVARLIKYFDQLSRDFSAEDDEAFSTYVNMESGTLRSGLAEFLNHKRSLATT
jgi:hypothetical protein